MKKDTIYIDVEDEITTITEKVQAAKAGVVALVLPKRCTVLQSSVNMKILQKGAAVAGKKVVLITNESALLPIAGATGMYVAKTLQSKPSIPAAIDDDPEDAVLVEDAPIDETKPIGELAGDTDTTDDDAPIELQGEAKPSDAVKTPKAKKDKKLKVPNFESFRLRLGLGIAAVILLIVGWVFAAVVLPKAQITIVTQNKSLPINTTVTASAEVKVADVAKSIVPLATKTLDKAETAKAPATGTKDVGTKASGKVTFYNCSKDDKLSDTVRTVPAGTGISSGSYTFITQTDATVSPSGYTGNTCKSDKPSAEVTVIAQSPGDKYNLSARAYAVSGFTSMSAVDKVGMGGGTTKEIKIVSEDDCTNLKNQLSSKKTDEYVKQLSDQLTSSGQVVIADSFTSANPGGINCTPAVGSEATEVTATGLFKYAMQGVEQSSLDQILQSEAQKTLNNPTQTVLNSGVSTAKLTTKERKSATNILVAVSTTATTGIKQDAGAIKDAVAGKKYGETVQAIESLPGVSNVTVEYSPFWVRKTPSNPDKITIIFKNESSTSSN